MTPTDISQSVHDVTERVFNEHDLDTSLIPEEITVERPRLAEHGDYATNIAMQLAKKAGTNPRELAGWIAEALQADSGIEKVDVAGPGFINITVSKSAQGNIVQSVLDQGDDFGHNDMYDGLRVNLEFVSANPTGPIHLGGTRWAAVGDALGRVLEASGAKVTREYYFNDHGEQIHRFARSLIAAAKGEPTPEDGYGGDYIQEIAQAVMEQNPQALDGSDAEVLEEFRSRGVEMMFDHIKKSLHEFGTDFDVYFHENSLFESGAVDKAIEKLKSNGSLYFDDGAWWMRTTQFGDEKDRVVIKSDGNAAYIAGDIAYVGDKIERGHDLCIYMLGADHHGYINRLKAAAQGMGYKAEQVEVLIGQMVNLKRDGQAVRMSKRAGTVITLDDLVAAVGYDAARYSLVRSSVNTSLDIDLSLWESQSSESPVYYVQYAHARTCALQRKADEAGVSAENADLSLLVEEREGELIRTLGDFPRVVKTAAEMREPHHVTRYAEELAGAFNRFYVACPILPAAGEDPSALNSARLDLTQATRQVLANALRLVGVTAPERM